MGPGSTRRRCATKPAVTHRVLVEAASLDAYEGDYRPGAEKGQPDHGGADRGHDGADGGNTQKFREIHAGPEGAQMEPDVGPVEGLG